MSYKLSDCMGKTANHVTSFFSWTNLGDECYPQIKEIRDNDQDWDNFMTLFNF